MGGGRGDPAAALAGRAKALGVESATFHEDTAVLEMEGAALAGDLAIGGGGRQPPVHRRCCLRRAEEWGG